MSKDAETMTDDDLLLEIKDQEQWAGDDYFEFVALDRGDGGRARDGYIASLYQAAASRGLIQLPPQPKDHPDFEAVVSWMSEQGFELCDIDLFRKWSNGRNAMGHKHQVGFASFDEALAAYQAGDSSMLNAWGE